MQKTYYSKLGFTFILLIMFFLGGCRSNERQLVIPDHLANVSIPSLREVMGIFTSEAQQWDPDAGMDLAIIDINPKEEKNFRQITAFYESPNEDYEFLMVQSNAFGHVTSVVDSYYRPNADLNPIADSDWILDSVDAWNIFLSNPKVLSAEKGVFECAVFVLINNGEIEEEKKTAWRLALNKCDDNTSDYYHIDAITGDIIDTQR